MMKTITCSIGLMLVCSVVSAQITMDGDLSDWNASYIHSDPVGDNPGNLDLIQWGAYCDGTWLYTFQTIVQPPVLSPLTGPWLDLWCDVDNSDSTELGSLSHGPVSNEIGWYGADITPQLEHPGSSPTTLSFYGYGDDWWECNAPCDSSDYQWGMSADGKIYEYAVRVSTLVAEVATYPDGAVAGDIWQVGTRIDGVFAAGAKWGADVSVSKIIAVADINGDGAVNNSDLPLGDADFDGDVDAADLATWGYNYTGVGGTGGSWEEGDFDQDGDVDAADLATWGFNYTGSGASTSMGVGMPASVPEPATMALLGLGGLGLIRRRRA